MVAEAQRQWAQAEGYYQQALAIYVEFNDRYTQAAVYYGLGRVAEEQRQWAQAEGITSRRGPSSSSSTTATRSHPPIVNWGKLQRSRAYGRRRASVT